MYPAQNDRLTLLRAVESARNGIVLTDPNIKDNPIIYANPAFIELTGYEMDEIVGKNCRFLQATDRSQENIQAIKKTIEKGESITTIIRNYKKNGELFYNELTISPVYDESNKLVNFIGIQNDVTARMELEQRISDFYSMISHELRTPVSSINASLLALEDGSVTKLSSPGAKLVKIALSNCKRLIGLINNILDWKKLQAGKFKLQLQPWPAEEIIDTVIQEITPVAVLRRIKLEKKIISSAKIVMDPDRIAEVLTNLVSNAIKFSPDDTTISITLECGENAGSRIKYSVIDQGCGIATENTNKLFLQFQQLDSTERRPKAGTGLGLAICKAIVELHRGQIGVKSKLNEGSTFWFSLPELDYQDFDLKPE
ncbi:PAS domain-containing protein [bacterium]|nr:PAS domain-containing protein [bacterium]QQR59723.1 MAG: PAS domain-containing protein [Candidatus Melainabacteria bacterium]